MKKLQRKQIVAVAIMIFCAACAGAGAVYANDSAMRGKDIAAAIAQKFNLDEAQVQAVFDRQRDKMQANREEMETKRQEQFESRLDKLVSEGKLTEAQAAAIKAKKAELETAREANKNESGTEFKNMTEEERKAAMEERKTKMEAQREALKQWAQDNGISEEYLPMVGMGFAGGGHGRGGGFGGSEFGGNRPCLSEKN
jgi:hypothetical protein